MTDSAPNLPYGRHWVDEEDIRSVSEALRSDWLTTGPLVERLEQAFAQTVGAKEAVVVNSGTAALHCSMHALGLGAGDEVLVPAITFAATSNAVLYVGATPKFIDVEEHSLLMNPELVERAITPRTKAIVTVDYAGQPSNYDELNAICQRHGLKLVSDACHALGGRWKGKNVGTLADLSSFSLHPVKHITSGEGGVVTTDSQQWAKAMRAFRSHGISTDVRTREKLGTWVYDMEKLGFNYRMPDINCALGLSQLKKLDQWVKRRREIASRYEKALAEHPIVETLSCHAQAEHAYHLYVIKLKKDSLVQRAEAFEALRARHIGVNVHYRPVYLHSYYQGLGYKQGLCPVAEEVYQRILSLPIFPSMSDADVDRVVANLNEVLPA